MCNPPSLNGPACLSHHYGGRMDKIKYKFMDAWIDNSGARFKQSGDDHLHRDHNDNTVRNNVTFASFGCSDVKLEGYRNDAASPMYRRELHTIPRAPEQEDLGQDFTQFKLPAVVNSDRLLADVGNATWPASRPSCPVAVGDRASRPAHRVDTKNPKTHFDMNSIRGDKERLIPALRQLADRGKDTQSVNTSILSNADSVTPLDILSSVACAEHRRLASCGPNIEQSSSQTSQNEPSGNFVNERVSSSLAVSSDNVPATSMHICSTSSPSPVCQPMSNSSLLPTGRVCSVNIDRRPVCIQESNLVVRKPPLYTSPALPPVCVDATGISVMQRVNHGSISTGKTHLAGDLPFHGSFVVLPTAMTLPITTSPAAKQLTPVSRSGMKVENRSSQSTGNNEMSAQEWRPSVGKSLHRKRRKQRSNHHASSSAVAQHGAHSSSDKRGNHIPPEMHGSRTFQQSSPCPTVPVSRVRQTFVPSLQEPTIPKSLMMTMVSQQSLPPNLFPPQPGSRDRGVYDSFTVRSHEPNLAAKKSPALTRLAWPVTNGKYCEKEMNAEAKEFSVGKVYSKDKPVMTESTVNGYSSTADQRVTMKSDIRTCLGRETKQVTLVTSPISTTISDLRATSVPNSAHINKNTLGNTSSTSEGCATTAADKPNKLNVSGIATHKNTLCKHYEANVPTANKDQLCETREGGLLTSEPKHNKCTVSSRPESLVTTMSGGFRNVSDHSVNTKAGSKSGETHQSRRKRVGEEDSNCKWAKRRRPNDAVIVCSLCQHTVNYNLEWKRHIKEKHWDLVQTFSCKECFIPFESKAEFLQHLSEEHPKMLPFRLLPEKMFCTMIEEHKQFKRKSECNVSNESDQPGDRVTPNAVERIASVQPPPPAMVSSQPVSPANHTAPDTGSVPATNENQEKKQLTDATSHSEQPPDVTGLSSSTENAEISCATEMEGNAAERVARRMSKDEGYTTDTISRLDSGNDWQNDNDNASTKSYAESPDRNISDSEIPPTPTREESEMNDDDCQLLYCHYPDDHQSAASQPAKPATAEFVTAGDVSKNEESQEITTGDQRSADQLDHQEQISTETTTLPKTFIEVGNSRRKLNIRPGFLNSRLYKRKFKNPQRKNVSRHGFRFRRSNSMKKRKRKTKMGFLCDDLDDATLPDLDLPGREIKTDTDIQPASPFTDNQVCASNQYRSERGIDSDEEMAVDLTEEKDEINSVRPGSDVIRSRDECPSGDTESAVAQSTRQSEVVFDSSRSHSETTPSDVQLVLTDCRRCFVKLERKAIIDNLKGGTLRTSGDGLLLEVPDDDDGVQPPVCRHPESEEASGECDARHSRFTQGSTRNRTSLITNNETKQSAESDFSCDQGYGSNNWSCMLCTYSSIGYESLRQHVQEEHVVHKRFFCPKCSVSSDEYRTVEDHVLCVHKDVTAIVLSRRCPQEQDLIDALCLWLPRELKWKNIKLKLERAAKMSTFIRSKLNFNDSKRYTCYVCNKQLKGSVLIRKHVAAYWKLVNNTGSAHEEVLTDSDVLKELFDRRCRVIPRRHSASLRDTSTDNYGMEEGIPDKHSNGKFRKLSKTKYQPSHEDFTNALYTASVDSSDSSLCDSIVETSDRPIRKTVDEGRSVWTTFGKMSDASSGLPCSVPADSLKSSCLSSTAHKDCPTGGTKEGLFLRLVRTSPSCQFDGDLNHASCVANTTSSTSENKRTSPVLSSFFANHCFGPASAVEGGTQLKLGGLYSDCNRLVKPDTKLNMKPTVLLQSVSKYTQNEQV